MAWSFEAGGEKAGSGQLRAISFELSARCRWFGLLWLSYFNRKILETGWLGGIYHFLFDPTMRRPQATHFSCPLFKYSSLGGDLTRLMSFEIRGLGGLGSLTCDFAECFFENLPFLRYWIQYRFADQLLVGYLLGSYRIATGPPEPELPPAHEPQVDMLRLAPRTTSARGRTGLVSFLSFRMGVGPGR